MSQSKVMDRQACLRRKGYVLAVSLLLLGMHTYAAEPEVSLIGSKALWRKFLVRQTEFVRFEDGDLSPVQVSTPGRGWPKMKKIEASTHTPLPPDGWMRTDYDDSSWASGLMRMGTGRSRSYSVMCLRTRFHVADPAEVGDMELSVAYRGGVIVYLNGAEIARSDMPEGAVDLNTPSKDYPRDAYVSPEGHLMRMGFNDPVRHKDRFALRSRKTDAITVPASKLRPGVNVLALSAHRPPTDAILYTGRPHAHSWKFCPWEPLSVDAVALTARSAKGTGLLPAGLILSNSLTVDSRNTKPDIWAPFRPLRFFGARNGVFSSTFWVSSRQPLDKLRVEMPSLQGASGKIIPREAITVRYADGEALQEGDPGLVPVPEQSRLASQRLWVTVSVPPETEAGIYRGELKVSADGAEPITAPMELSVADWTLADASAFETYFDMVQSPETLAHHYAVEMWSEQHWKLIDRSFALMGQVGSRVLYIPIIRQSHFGNEHSMIRWVKQADGSWSHDYSIMEKYLETAVRRLGALHMVCVHAWGRGSGGAYFGMADKETMAKPFWFSAMDPETGALTAEEGPSWEDEACASFLKPVFDGIRERLKPYGLEHTMMVGIGHDVLPSSSAVATLKKASSSSPWVMHCHPVRWKCGSEPVGYLAHVWGTRAPSLNPERREYGWRETRLLTTFPRSGSETASRVTDRSPPMQYRLMRETAMCTALRGFGWMGADFWPVIKRRHTYLDYYHVYDFRSNLGIGHAMHRLLAPGPEGALATVRLEMVREGAQEAEARVFIERALHDPGKRAALSEDLVKRCQALLDERLRLIVYARDSWDLAVCNDWDRKMKADLYNLAAEVAQSLPQASPATRKQG